MALLATVHLGEPAFVDRVIRDTVAVVRLFANAFSGDRGRCFRWVYEASTTRPMRCGGEVVTNGWWQDRMGRWWAVDACREHADSLSPTGLPSGARLGQRTARGRLDSSSTPRRRRALAA
jgi:hypothetical protein